MESRSLLLHAVGDVGFTGDVMRRIREGEGDYPFGAARSILADADVVIGNLEIPVLASGFESANPTVPRSLVATAESIARLARAGFDVVSLANNHVMDHGVEGLRATLHALGEEGVAAVGAGEDLTEARTPWIAERHGLRFGILAYTSSKSTWAGERSPGAAPMLDEIIDADLAALRPTVDIVALSLHFGLMYTDFPQIEDQRRLRRWIDRGVDVILGHHPHVCQGIEAYRGGLIAYSLGEFVFDPRSGNVLAENSLQIRRQTMVLSCRFHGDRLDGWDYVPFVIGDDLSPMPASEEEGRSVRSRIEALSAPLEGDGLLGIDVAGHSGSRLVVHELRVLWFHAQRLNVRYLATRALALRPRHLRMLWGMLRRRFTGRG